MRESVMPLLLLMMLLVVSCTPETGEVDALGYSNTFRRVRFVDNYDGDTMTVNISRMPPVFGFKIPVRIKHIDTAEMKGKTDCEKFMAQAARERVRYLVDKALRIDLERAERGSFFRILADVRLLSMRENYLLASRLLREGYAVPYEGGSKPDTDWCAQRKIMESRFR